MENLCIEETINEVDFKIAETNAMEGHNCFELKNIKKEKIFINNIINRKIIMKGNVIKGKCKSLNNKNEIKVSDFINSLQGIVKKITIQEDSVILKLKDNEGVLHTVVSQYIHVELEQEILVTGFIVETSETSFFYSNFTKVLNFNFEGYFGRINHLNEIEVIRHYFNYKFFIEDFGFNFLFQQNSKIKGNFSYYYKNNQYYLIPNELSVIDANLNGEIKIKNKKYSLLNGKYDIPLKIMKKFLKGGDKINTLGDFSFKNSSDFFFKSKEFNVTESYLEGFISKIKYENEINFFILETHNEKKESIILKGYCQNIRVGDYFKSHGNLKYTKKGKYSFDSNLIEIIEPTKEECILEYLSSGIIKGIGKGNASNIFNAFGVDSLKIIDQSPEKLLRLPKIGQKTLTKIVNSWLEVKPSEQIVGELIKLGFKSFEATKIYKNFGNESITILQTYPYNIAIKVKTIGFKNIDFAVLKMGFPSDSPVRIKATITHFLHEIQQGGDCIIDKNEALSLVVKYLIDIDIKIIEECLEEGIKKGLFQVIIKNNITYIQTEHMHNQELELAKRLYHLHSNKDLSINKVNEITFIEKKIPFNPEQTEAIKGSLNNKISVITGKPGVGKTTVVNEIIKQFEALEKDVLLCAPTGKAAQKMTEASGKPASTIHRLLEFNPIKDGFTITDDNPLELDVIIIDEASMIDIYLFVHLLRALPINAQIVIVGDIGQLPSVNPGATLRDIIFSNKIPVFRIETIMRQKGSSYIVTNAHAIDKGNFDFNRQQFDNVLEDFYFIPTSTDESTLNKMQNIINTKLKKTFDFSPHNDLQILSATHQGELGTENLNCIMQNILNKENKYFIEKGNFQYKENDKVIQTVNNYEKDIYNGDTGTITKLNEKGIFVIFDNGKSSEYTRSEMDDLLPSYVITGHKSQGSEYPVVIIPLPQVYTQVIDRSWIYTTITRGKSLVILVGSKEVFQRGIKSEKSRHRNTYLMEKIVEIFNFF